MNSLGIHNEFMKRQRTGELLAHHQPFILMSSLQSDPYTDEICAQAIAEFLERHPKVDVVRYPGLKSFPQKAISRDLPEPFIPTAISCDLP